MNNPIQKQFDFTNFAAKVDELNHMHKLVHELSERRWHSGKAEDIERWEKAVKDWKEFSGFSYPETKFYFFENQTFLTALSSGETDAKESAIKFLEFDPYYYRSGYIKSKLQVRLKILNCPHLKSNGCKKLSATRSFHRSRSVNSNIMPDC